MRLADAVEGAEHTALEQREVALDRVRMMEAARLDVFLGRVVDRAMSCELATDRGIHRRFVRHQIGATEGVRNHDRSQRCSRNVSDVEAPRLAVALDQREHGHLADRTATSVFPLASVLVALLAADVGLVCLNYLVRAVEGRGERVACRRTEPVKQEPCRLVGNPHHAAQLQRRHALLARRHKMRREHPLVQLDVAVIHDRADRHGERLAAVLALVDARTGAFALQLGNPILHDAAARTDRALRPEHGFKVFASHVVIVEHRAGKIEFGSRHG